MISIFFWTCQKIERFVDYIALMSQNIPNQYFVISFLPWKGYLFLAHLSWKLKCAFLIACCLSSVCLSSVCPFVNFSHFQLLLQNHWANLNQTWHKAGIQVCSNVGPHLFPRGDNCENVKLYWKYFKNLLLQNHWANFNQTWHKASLGGGDSSLFKFLKRWW